MAERSESAFFLHHYVNKLTIWYERKSIEKKVISDPTGSQADGDAVKKKPAEAAAAGCFRQRQESMHVTDRHFGENREKPDRTTANDLIRHDQMVVHRKIKRLERS